MYEIPPREAPLRQGDIFQGNFAFSYTADPAEDISLLRNDVLVPANQVADAWATGSERIVVYAYRMRLVVVLSNSCDISGERQPLEVVTVGAALPITEIRNNGTRENCRRNKVVRFHHLRSHPEPNLQESFVHFGLLALINTERLLGFRQARLLTLISPYRESLGHRFAEFLSRVAVP